MDLRPTPYEGRYIHGIDLGDWYPCWNLTLAGRLWSPDFAAMCDPGLAAAHHSIRTASIETLRTRGIPQGVPTPRATWCVWAASIIRGGGHVGIGTENTRWYSKADCDRFLRIGDIELSFEEARRKLLPDGASRLSSLYLADDSDVGRAHVRSMFGAQVHILRVTIPLALRVTKVDTKWFDLYERDPKSEYLEKYWTSVPFNESSPTWEYLVDGMIEVDNAGDLEYVRIFGAKVPGASRNP